MADSISHGARVETPGPENSGGGLDDFYAIRPADILTCIARNASPATGSVHMVLTSALTTYCGAIRGVEIADGEVGCIRCLIKWAAATPEGREALIDALALFRARL